MVETKVSFVSGILAEFMWERKSRYPKGSQHVAHLAARSLTFPVAFSLGLTHSTAGQIVAIDSGPNLRHTTHSNRPQSASE